MKKIDEMTLRELYNYDIENGTQYIFDRISEMTEEELEEEISYYNRVDLNGTYELCMFLETQMPYTIDGSDSRR